MAGLLSFSITLPDYERLEIESGCCVGAASGLGKSYISLLLCL